MFNRRCLFRQSVAALSVLAGGSATRSLLSAPSVSPFGDAVVIAGSPRDRGRRYGQRFEGGIRAFLEREIYRAFDASVAKKDDLLRYSAACFRVIRAECPTIADELEGMAEATGLR